MVNGKIIKEQREIFVTPRQKSEAFENTSQSTKLLNLCFSNSYSSESMEEQHERQKKLDQEMKDQGKTGKRSLLKNFILRNKDLLAEPDSPILPKSPESKGKSQSKSFEMLGEESKISEDKK